MSDVVVAGSVAFLVAGVLVPLLVRFAVGRNLLDVPNLRSSHEIPTPRLGGVAIILGSWAGALILRPEGAWPLLTAATLIGAVGLLDDLGNLHFGTKAAAQTLVAGFLVFFYAPPLLSEAPGLLKALVFVVGTIWIVSLSNAFNFMDGIDGIIGGVALVNVVFLSVLAGGGALPVVAGATAGFLIWNVNPASIFLGDSGSYFLGFFLAAVALYAPLPGAGWSPLSFVACVSWSLRRCCSTQPTRSYDVTGRGRMFSPHTGSICTNGSHPPPICTGAPATSTTGLAPSPVSRRFWRSVGGSLLLPVSPWPLLCCAALLMLPIVVRTEN